MADAKTTEARDTLQAHEAKVAAYAAENGITVLELSDELQRKRRQLREAAKAEAEKEAGLFE
jgi:TRAP-type C4-dicarboxylate transport system substrate-binding protein